MQEFLLSLTVLLPFAIGLIRLRKIHTSYWPFLVVIACGLLSELIGYYAIRVYKNNAVVTSVYYLVECTLLMYQFYIWRFQPKPRNWFWLVLAIVLIGWLIENVKFYVHGKFSPYFHISYSFLIVMLSIIVFNTQLTHERGQLFKNARFLLCLAFIIFFLYQILLEWGYMVAAKQQDIAAAILSYQSYINALTNILYAVAILYIPAKRFDFDRTLESIKEQQRKSGPKIPSGR